MAKLSSLVFRLLNCDLFQIFPSKFLHYRITTLQYSNLQRLWHCLAYLVLVLFVARVMAISLWAKWTGSSDFMQHYRQYDPLMDTALRQLNLFKPYQPISYIGFASSFLYLFGAYIHYHLYYGLDRYVLNLFHQVVIQNEQLLSKNWKPRLSRVPLYYRPIVAARHYETLWKSGESMAPIRVAKLASFPHLPPLIHIRTRMITKVVDYTLAAMNFLVPVILLCPLMLIYLRTTSHYVAVCSVQFAIIACELTYIVYFSWNTVRCALFALGYLLILAFVYRSYICTLDRSLSNWVDKCTSSSDNKHKNHKWKALGRRNHRQVLALKLTLFGREYCRIVRALTHINQKFVVSSTTMVLCTLLPFNVLIIATLVFEKTTTGEKIVYFAIAYAQIMAVLQICAICIWLCGALYRTRRFMFRAQALLTSQQTAAKLKLLTVYELVHSKKRFTFNFGPMGKITKKAIYLFLYVYSAYIMTAFDLIHQTQT